MSSVSVNNNKILDNPDLFSEILSFLEPVNICSIKSVSKSWINIINGNPSIMFHLTNEAVNQSVALAQANTNEWINLD